MGSHICLKEYQNGKIVKKAAFDILRRKHIIAFSNKCTRLARDSEEFMAFFDRELNPHIDLETLSQGDYRTRINYVRHDGEIGSILVHSFFLNLAKNNGKFVEWKTKNKPVLEISRFVEWFDRYKAYNKDVDVENLKTAQRDTLLYYVDDSGIKKSITLRNLLKREDIFVPVPKEFAMEDEDFARFFEKERDFNDGGMEGVTKSSQKKKICYLSTNNTIESKIVKRCFDNKGRRFEMPVKSVQNFVTEDFSYEHIRRFFKGDGSAIPCECKKGHSFYADPAAFIMQKGDPDCLCPECGGQNRHPGFAVVKPRVKPEESAAAVDPEIALFWGNNLLKADEVAPYSSRKFNMVCPYCGYGFSRVLRYFINNHPKCPRCKDMGDFVANDKGDNLPEGIIFGIRTN